MADETTLMLDDEDALPVDDAPETAVPDATEAKSSLDDIIDQAIDDTDAAPDGRPRDENGRFAKKSDDAEAPEDGPSEVAVESAEPPSENAQAVAAPQFTDGHFRGWLPEQREQFQKLAPEVQSVAYEVIQQRDKYYTDRINEYQQSVAPLIESVQPHFDRIQASGLDVQTYVGNVMRADHALMHGTYEQKQQLVADLAKMAGIPIQITQADEWADPLQPGGQAYPVIHDLNARLAQQQQELQRFKSLYEQQHEAQTASQLHAFAATTGPDGSPKYPHFERVRAAMGQLMASGQAQTLEAAYTMAAKPIDDAITQEVERRTKAAAEAQKAAIEKAKKARPLRTSATGANGRVVSKGIDAHLQAALSALPD